jgi:hypothetical protein
MPSALLADCGSFGEELAPSESCLVLVGKLRPGWIPGLGPDLRVDVDALVSALGAPDSSSSTDAYEEHFSGYLMRTITMHWPALTVAVDCVEGESPPSFWLTSLEVRSRAFPLPCGLALGMSESVFTSKFGEPTRRYERRQVYDWAYQECLEDQWYAWYAAITLILSADRAVEEIRWEYEGD